MQRKNVIQTISLNEQQKKHLMGEIEAFYLDQFGETPGIIKQQQILELFMEQLAPVIYNKALDDARRWYGGQMERLDSDFYELYRPD